MPGRRRHSAAFDRMVRAIQRKGGATNAYAVATARLGRKSFRRRRR
ncbi:MAG: hypothetical protein ACREEC_09345 [Thermoplasmata archaeon]